jgi:hypothetical protein
MRWLAEATYTGEALQYSLNNMINNMKLENRVVLVLTDGRSDTNRDNVPLNTLCGKGIRVGHAAAGRPSARPPAPALAPPTDSTPGAGGFLSLGHFVFSLKAVAEGIRFIEVH